ncbi:nickel-dependent hydrogenase large subunit [Thiocystis violacea]|uniref:nickel-dependent hydrogenase large subunit n=1 Tax=Thiocystis violacea TaxID=13725 RepID=UPI001905694B|nr:nickel-dependent hydrogenase large subunit [Thiocystis violacea]MBK1716246.1 Ni,Fe-hydrogenase I large subunit [Thiocystis violacea]
MSDPAGRLNIQLRRTPQGLACAIRSTRPVTAASMFAGRSVTQTATLLPMLYSICAKAQASACASALESATGLVPTDPVRAARGILVKIETIREHLWRILLDWPRLSGDSPDQASTALLLARVKALLTLVDPDGDLFQPGVQAVGFDRDAALERLDELDALVARAVLGMTADQWLEAIARPDDLVRWIGTTETSAARLLRTLSAAGEASLGQCESHALPELDPRALSARLLAPDAADFQAAPSWDGCPRETSPFTRQADHEPMPALVARHGNGLLPRLVAPLLEVARLLSEVRATLTETMPASEDPRRAAPGVGLGRVEAARGRLVHLARVEQGRILDYRILAPTEWNFHPEGLLAKALSGLPMADEGRLARWAELLILSTDPCVAYDLLIAPSASCHDPVQGSEP